MVNSFRLAEVFYLEFYGVAIKFSEHFSSILIDNCEPMIFFMQTYLGLNLTEYIRCES